MAFGISDRNNGLTNFARELASPFHLDAVCLQISVLSKSMARQLMQVSLIRFRTEEMSSSFHAGNCPSARGCMYKARALTPTTEV